MATQRRSLESETTGPAAGTAAYRPRLQPRWWPFSFSPSLVFVVACSVAVLAVGIALALRKGAAPAPRIVHARVVGVSRGHRARASLRIRGTRARLLFHRLPRPGTGRVSEVWVERGSGVPLAAGTFTKRSGSVMLTRPVRRGDRVVVTVEPTGGSIAPTTAPFVVARV